MTGPNYSLNSLIENLSQTIEKMDMPGFDAIKDDCWNGEKEFEIEFKDCTAVLSGEFFRRYEEKELVSQEFFIKECYLQLEQTEVFLNTSDQDLILQSIKIE